MTFRSDFPEVPFPTEREMARGFAAYLRSDPEFQQAVGCDVATLEDEDVLMLHDIMTTEPMEGTCDVLGCPCYYDGTSLGAEEFVPAFLEEGEKAVWAMLEERYNDRFGEEAR